MGNQISSAAAFIDSHSLFWRALTGIDKSLVNKEGEQVAALWGFTKSLEKILNLKPRFLVPIFDRGGKTFRHEIYPDYKAGRTKMTREQHQQMGWVYRSLEILQATPINRERYEADDIIAQFSREHKPCFIVSPDKDLLQLVGDGVSVYNQTTGEFLDSAAVQAKMGVPPSLVAGLLAIMGDKADSIHGIPGIGPKTAAEMLCYARLEAASNTPEEVVLRHALKNLKYANKAQATAIQKHGGQALKNLKLTKLDHRVPVKINLQHYRVEEFNIAGWRDWVSEKVN